MSERQKTEAETEKQREGEKCRERDRQIDTHRITVIVQNVCLLHNVRQKQFQMKGTPWQLITRLSSCLL